MQLRVGKSSQTDVSSEIPVADVLCIYQQYGDDSNEQISEHISTYHLLPTVTGILASPAKMLGGFGLVRGGSTNPYQGGAPYQKTRVECMCRRLPNVTKHYQGPDLSLPRP